jgi:hypothetical protein
MKAEPATRLPECVEGPEAFSRFDATVSALLAVPHSTLARRERAYRKKAAANPRKPGPKPKAASGHASNGPA